MLNEFHHRIIQNVILNEFEFRQLESLVSFLINSTHLRK